MASIRRFPNGKWQAQVAKQGVRRSKVFSSKAEARDWAARQEYEIAHADEKRDRTPLAEVLDRYAREVSPKKRGARWEMLRLENLGADKIGRIAISELKSADLADWRDRRLREVAPGTVRREMILLRSALSVARKEWGLLSVNPASEVRAPASPPARERLPTAEELDRLAVSAGADLTNATARAFHAFLFAIETAMRAGEILSLRPGDVDKARQVARLRMTKNGLSRDVPLSREAVRLLDALPEADPLFNLTSRQLDALWRKLRDRAAVEGLRFHDSRAEATTRLSKKVDVLTLARITGHQDIRQLLTYYRETAADIAKKL